MRMNGAVAALVAALLAACGGGGGGGGSADAGTSAGGAGTGGAAAACTPTMADPFACQPRLGLSLTDAAGASLTSLAPERPGVLTATLRQPDGQPLSNVVVAFSTDAGTATTPATTALTDSSGVARVGLPAGTKPGAYTAGASATVGGSVVRASVNYAVVFPVLTLSVPTGTPSPLSAGGTASVSVTVSSEGQPYGLPLPVSFSSPCAAAGKALLSSPVTTVNGVASASYTDQGCGTHDPITASVTLGDTTVTQTGLLRMLPAAAGSIGFVSTDTAHIALAGTGSAGRQEFANLTFKVFDTRGLPLPGASVEFAFADSNASRTVGGLALQPAAAVTGAEGTATVQVAGGTIPTSVRVMAGVRGLSGLVTTLSDQLVVSTGVPDQSHFSLSSSTGNCEGWNIDQDCSDITAALADHFGNPVPDGTAVSFSAEGGSIEASCVTQDGRCSVKFRAGKPRPANGRVTILAYALGEEDFFDANGNNRCDDCSATLGKEFTAAYDRSPDIYRDDNEDGQWTAGEPCVGPNANGRCSTPGDKKYNGVLQAPSSGGASGQTVYVSRQLVQTLSGSHAKLSYSPARLSCPANGMVNVQFVVQDSNGNPMPADSKIELSAMFGIDSGTVSPASFSVPEFPLAVGAPTPGTVYTVTVGCPSASAGQVLVKVTTPANVVSMLAIPVN